MYEKPDISAQQNVRETRHFSLTKCMRNQTFQLNKMHEKPDISAECNPEETITKMHEKSDISS
jgi:hypothetical protein